MIRLLSKYKNGNYTVKLYADGTKVKSTAADVFRADFPDSIDLKITDRCDLACPMCHESSSPSGAHADLSAPFLHTLTPGTELAIGGGNPLSHPELKQFLLTMKARGIISNITVNEKHLLADTKYIDALAKEKLVYGIGVSLSCYSPDTFRFASEHPNTVFHIIAGVVTENDLKKIADGGVFKLLILGYKNRGRGKDFYSPAVAANIETLKQILPKYFPSFRSISFDNLALSQLGVKDMVDPQTYESSFMGDDGEASMFIDLVKREYAVSSTSELRYPLEDDLSVMFEKVRIKK